MKITSHKLKEIIKEELERELLEQSNLESLDEGWKDFIPSKRNIAALGAGLAMMGGMGKAQAAPQHDMPGKGKAVAASVDKSKDSVSQTDLANAAKGMAYSFMLHDKSGADKMNAMFDLGHVLAAIDNPEYLKDKKFPDGDSADFYKKPGAMKNIVENALDRAKKFSKDDEHKDFFAEMKAKGAKISYKVRGNGEISVDYKGK